MLRNYRNTLIVTSVVAALPIAVGVALWNRLPAAMATHFTMAGEPNGFSSKPFAVFGLPLLCIALEWVCAYVTSRDPKRQNVSPKLLSLVLWTVPAISVAVSALTYSYNLGHPVNSTLFVGLLMGLMLIVLGNYLPKARQNRTIGIRIPWTLANEQNWNRTHRLAGYLWVAGGIVLIALGLTGAASAPWMLATVVAVSLVPAAYSYWLHAREGL